MESMACCAPVAQLDRAPDYESGGQEFESLRARHHFKDLGERRRLRRRISLRFSLRKFLVIRGVITNVEAVVFESPLTDWFHGLPAALWLNDNLLDCRALPGWQQTRISDPLQFSPRMTSDRYAPNIGH